MLQNCYEWIFNTWDDILLLHVTKSSFCLSVILTLTPEQDIASWGFKLKAGKATGGGVQGVDVPPFWKKRGSKESFDQLFWEDKLNSLLNNIYIYVP